MGALGLAIADERIHLCWGGDGAAFDEASAPWYGSSSERCKTLRRALATHALNGVPARLALAPSEYSLVPVPAMAAHETEALQAARWKAISQTNIPASSAVAECFATGLSESPMAYYVAVCDRATVQKYMDWAELCGLRLNAIGIRELSHDLTRRQLADARRQVGLSGLLSLQGGQLLLTLGDEHRLMMARTVHIDTTDVIEKQIQALVHEVRGSIQYCMSFHQQSDHPRLWLGRELDAAYPGLADALEFAGGLKAGLVTGEVAGGSGGGIVARGAALEVAS